MRNLLLALLPLTTVTLCLLGQEQGRLAKTNGPYLITPISTNFVVIEARQYPFPPNRLNNGTNMFTVFPDEMIVSTNYLRESITNGEVCKIVGHIWNDGRMKDGPDTYADYHPGVFYRTCKICGLTQRQSLTGWK